MVKIYARDIAEHLRNDAFFGEGFEELLRKAEKEDREVVVGNFLNKPEME